MTRRPRHPDSLALTLFVAVAVGACAVSEPEPPSDRPPDSWQAFVAANAQQLPDGRYLFHGDVAVSESRLRELFEAQRQRQTYSSVYNTGAADFTWDVAQRLELTWCSAQDFGSADNNKRITNAMLDATAEWERATDVNYIYRFGEDGAACEPGAGGVLFRVRLGTSGDCGVLGCPTARAFFPNDPSSIPEIVFWPAAFDLDTNAFMRVVRHELGHTLGLFHEHARFDQSEVDFEDGACLFSVSDDFFALTPADGKSVMGYPQCKGAVGSQQVLSAYDRLGVRYLYGLPRRFGRNETFNFDNGLENDVFWYDPNGSWHLATASGVNAIDFQVSAQCDYTSGGCTAPVVDGLPIAAQWQPQYTMESVMIYGRRDLPDVMLHNRLAWNQGFAVDPFVWGGWSVPLYGRFHDDSQRGDVFFYAPGTERDWLLHPNPDETAAQHAYSQPLYLDPVVGDFGGLSENSEIVWRDPASNTGWVWTGEGGHGFEATAVDFDARGVKRELEYVPLYGDFDADGLGDLFWYGPGATADKLWLSNGSMAEPVDVVTKTVGGHYKAVVADFDGNGATDILWYGEGNRSDALWLFTPSTHRSVPVSIGGDYAPIAGNFNSSDWCADILWYASDLDVVIPWRSNCDGTFVQQPPIAVPASSFPVGYALGR